MINPDWAQEQLDKRVELGYVVWPGKQSDALTDGFIRKFLPWDEYVRTLGEQGPNLDELAYGILRYSNLLVHDGAVAALCRHDEVWSADDADVVVTNYPQDLVIVEWPFKYSETWTLKFAQRNPLHLVQWLYKHGCKDAVSRLFVIAYAHDREHWLAASDLGGIIYTLDQHIESGAWKTPKMLRHKEQWTRTDAVFHVV